MRTHDHSTGIVGPLARALGLGSLLALLCATQALAVAPANDTAAGAEVIPASGPFPHLTATTADITDATSAGDPPAPSCTFSGGPVSRGIWYRFTPTAATAQYRLSVAADEPTATTVDDTILGVYTSTGGAAGPFTELPTVGISDGCDEDGAAAEPFQSVLTTQLTGGTEYWIVVFKWDTPAPTAGNTAVQMRVSQALPPVNDDAASALPLSLNLPVDGTTVGAQNDYELAGAGCFSGPGNSASTGSGRDAVYTFQAPTAADYAFRVITPGGTSNDRVLYVASSMPGPGPPAQTVTACVAAANRFASSTVEEVSPVSLAGGQTVFVVVDQSDPGSIPFSLVAERIAQEAEPNDTPATANALPDCGQRGGIVPGADVDFFALGTPAAGFRVFSMVDGGASSSGDADLRVTTATDTLEFDDLDAESPFGALAPVIAGTPLDGAASLLRISGFNAATQVDPYRLYSVLQPPLASATPQAEPNDTPGQAQTSPLNYATGTVSPADTDVYAFTLPAKAQVFIGLDGDPLRDNTPINPALELLGPSATVVSAANGAGSTSSTTSGAGSLTSTTPNSPAEGLHYRAPTGGTYFARVKTATPAGGDYALSIAVGCRAGVGSPEISPTSLPDATVGEPYEQVLTATGGFSPYTLELASGALPDGLAIEPGGAIGGTPTVEGASPFIVRVTDDAGYVGDRAYSLEVVSPANPPVSPPVDPPVSPPVNPPAATCHGKTATITGTDGNDKLEGTENRDVIQALGGGDTIKGADGNDILCGGDDDDKVKGGDGKDKLYGEGGKDKLNGGGGSKDKCDGGPGKDKGASCEKGPEAK